MAREVESRADRKCEYCKMDQSLQGANFHLEHIIPQSRGGSSSIENLAWACPSCNLHKSDRLILIDPMDGQLASLFNPRKEKWGDHFRWDGYEIVGRTPTGRAVVAAFDLNHPPRLKI